MFLDCKRFIFQHFLLGQHKICISQVSEGISPLNSRIYDLLANVMRMGQKIFVGDEMEHTLEENFSMNKVLRSIT